MGFKSINQPSRSSQVEHNPKSSISFFWLERAGRWCSSPLSSQADHQKLNIIQKWAFHFLAREGGRWGLSPLTSLANIRCWMLYKDKHFIFLGGEGWWMGFKSIEQLSQSSEVEHNPKMSISFFWVERGGGWGSSPSTSPANHQKLNVIQKWGFHFFWLESCGRWGLSPSTSQADHQKLKVFQKWAFHFISWRGLADGVWVHRPARPIIGSWT